MKNDFNIKKQIEKALQSSPLLTQCAITVEVEDGKAVLSGHVDKYCNKELAKKIAKEVEGTKLISESLSILLNESVKISDGEIQAAIQEKFIKNFGNGHKDVKATVKDGYVMLDGRLPWKYQKELAVECIHCISGIKGIENNIVTPEVIESPVSEKDVLAAIYGDYSITSDIKVEIYGQRVILKGSVGNIDQKNLVTRLVRSVQNVSEVENFLIVDWKR